jgi:hypothetical protein
MHRKFLIPVILVCLFSCRELYNDFQPELNEEYLVVEGMISDDPGPYIVKITKALPYSNEVKLYDYRSEPETQAIVRILSDKGEDVILHETSEQSGTYITRPEDLTGEVGHAYRLLIETQKGDVYESLPSILMEKPDIPDLYAVAAEKTVLNESLPYGPEFAKKSGLEISFDVMGNSMANYVKIDNRTIQMSLLCYDSTFMELADEDLVNQGYRPLYYHKVDTFYCWSVGKPDPVPNMAGTGDQGSLVSGIPLGFIPQNPSSDNAIDTFFYTVDEKYLVQDINRFMDRGIIQEIIFRVFYSSYYLTDIQAYAISDTIYEYYRNLKNQAAASNKIFDPIPSDLKGNIRCLSDPGKSIYGIFTAASVMKKQFLIVWPGIYYTPRVIKSDVYYPFQSSGCTTEYPVFWRKY